MPLDLYLIALLPPSPLRERVRALKEEMRSRFGSGHALNAPAHITLQMPFRLEPEGASALVRLLEGFCSRQRPILLEIQGFGAFPPRVIFLRVGENERVAELEHALRAALAGEQGLKVESSGMPFHPHITIATRDLAEDAYRVAWEEFKDRDFRASFEASGLFLLKHNGQSWDVFQEFRFGRAS